MADEDMVRAVLDDDQAAIAELACPVCGASSGMPCARSSISVSWPWRLFGSYLHRARLAAHHAILLAEAGRELAGDAVTDSAVEFLGGVPRAHRNGIGIPQRTRSRGPAAFPGP